ncbi:MAG: hypothetical protein ACKVHP_04445 [Verrucomicrobiales bacterium]
MSPVRPDSSTPNSHYGSHPNVTATGRDPSKVADAFAQADVALTRAYLLDQQAMRQVLRRQELIYHLAGWMGLDGWARVPKLKPTTLM